MDENAIKTTANNLSYADVEELVQVYVAKGMSEDEAYLLIKAGEVYNRMPHGVGDCKCKECTGK
jgi:hypothetical protein